MQRLRPTSWLWLLAGSLVAGGLSFLYAQMPLVTRKFIQAGNGFYNYDGDYFEPPEGADEETEFYFARLVYQPHLASRWPGASWMIDTPKAERHFLGGIRRLTNIHARTMEHFVRATDPELFKYPWLYAVEPGTWDLSEAETAALREYLLRGGFLMLDDFHGTLQWSYFARGMSRIFPDRPIVDVPVTDPVFHTFYEINERVQIPGLQYLYTGQIWEEDGTEPHWRGIYDDSGRLMVIANHNMDLGDAWEHADNPLYPQKYTALAYHFGIDYVVYAMTH